MRRNPKLSKWTAVDLFAGGGGLTVGLKDAGFTVAAAVEVNPHAIATYKKNHSEVTTFEDDIRDISGADLIAESPTGRIDLIAGCPPCQGFSSLTSKWKRDDPRNGLVAEMTRLVREVKPLAVMMENVPGLGIKGKKLFDEFLEFLKSEKYIASHEVLQVADYGVPQHRRRLVLLAGKGFKIPLPPATHSRTGGAGLKKWVSIDKILKGLREPVTLKKAWEDDGPAAYGWHVVRNMSKENQRRIKQAKPGRSWRSIPMT